MFLVDYCYVFEKFTGYFLGCFILFISNLLDILLYVKYIQQAKLNSKENQYANRSVPSHESYYTISFYLDLLNKDRVYYKPPSW